MRDTAHIPARDRARRSGLWNPAYDRGCEGERRSGSAGISRVPRLSRGDAPHAHDPEPRERSQRRKDDPCGARGLLQSQEERGKDFIGMGE